MSDPISNSQQSQEPQQANQEAQNQNSKKQQNNTNKQKQQNNTNKQKQQNNSNKPKQQNNSNKQKQQNNSNKQKQPNNSNNPKQSGNPKQPAKKFDLSSYPLPEYVEQRNRIWDELQKQAQEKANVEKTPIKITLPDGSQKDGFSHQTTPMEIAESISQGLAQACIIAKVNGELWDMNRPLEKDSSLELLKFDSPEGRKVFWHSSAHVMGQALERKYHCKLCIGPPLPEDGFYYDMAVNEGVIVSSDDYEEIKKLVDLIIKEKQFFHRLEIPKEKALEMFKYSKYKTEIILNKVPDGATCTAYRCGHLIDLCKGPHIPHTGKIKGFEIYQNSSAYWLGKSTNDSLQRIYGISFPDLKQLKEWKHFREEAEKRDHRKIGTQQELFFFHPLSPGSAFFLPHGTRIYNTLLNFLRTEYHRRGYTEVLSPNLFNKHLWEISGHWENYKDNMFLFQCENVEFGLKPMNCPGHCLMFKHAQRSYRELPIRFADFGVLHRNELSGTLTGLTRVRRFQQDDAHIFCRPDQIRDEIRGCIEFMKHVYGIFDYTFALELSTRPEKFLGDVETWNEAESALKEILEVNFPGAWKENPGDGAFYGPKIDVHVTDALRRSYQCATIQLDFQLPRRFELEFVKPDGGNETPVIIHRALFGSVERFLAILIEHLCGKWPFWLSPRQCAILSVSESFVPYAEQVYKTIHSFGYYVDMDISDKKLAKKILLAQQAQYNIILVIGEQEVTSQTVNVRTRDNVVHGQKTVESLLEMFAQLVKEYK